MSCYVTYYTVTVMSKTSVKLVGGRFPLFTVDLKVTEGTPACPAKFSYSASAESLHHSVMSHYNNSFETLKGTRTCSKHLSLSLSLSHSLTLSLSFYHNHLIFKLFLFLFSVTDLIFYFDIFNELINPSIHPFFHSLSHYSCHADIVKIERRIMKNLFWAHRPTMQVSTVSQLYVRWIFYGQT